MAKVVKWGRLERNEIMRLRNIKGADEKIATSEFVVQNPKEWKNKWKEKLLKASKRSLARLSGIVRSFLLQIFSRLNLNRGFDTNRISGETSIFFDSLDTDRALRSRIKTVKWKKTQSSRERLRLLYRYMIRNKVKELLRDAVKRYGIEE